MLLGVLGAPLVIADPRLAAAWAAAIGAAMLAASAAAPLALAVWRGSAGLRTGVGAASCLVALLGLAATAIEPAVTGWRSALARAALGLPLAVIAAAASLARADAGALRIAATFLSPASRLLRIVLPLIAPGLFGGALIVFAAALADGLRPGPAWSLPLAGFAAGMIGLLRRR